MPTSAYKEKRDLKNRVYELLRERLIHCEYPPCSMLNEAQLSEELGVSRTPVREALNRIEHENLVRIIPKKGIYVTGVGINDVLHIFEARLEIEPVALRMSAPLLPEDQLLEFKAKFMGEEPEVRAAFRLDTAMHLFLIEYCGNRYIIDMMRKVFDENTRIIISSKQNEAKIHDARREHVEILDFLLNKEYELAQKAVRLHIERCKKAALNFFYNFNAFTANNSETTYRSLLHERCIPSYQFLKY